MLRTRTSGVSNYFVCVVWASVSPFQALTFFPLSGAQTGQKPLWLSLIQHLAAESSANAKSADEITRKRFGRSSKKKEQAQMSLHHLSIFLLKQAVSLSTTGLRCSGGLFSATFQTKSVLSFSFSMQFYVNLEAAA